ncbi:MAG: hypothetical protein OXG46_06035 [Chloroflexi bacterium]|nr:hypothetical protein [Chloroflexota bacterium]MCY3937902.1 hypothetical protein [Chloroflexota bacterium]
MKTSGLRRLGVVAALAAGVALALAAMPGCGSDCPTPEQRAYLNEAEDWADRTEAGYGDLLTIMGEVPSRPEALIDEEWRRRLRRVLDEVDAANREMAALEPPAGAEEVHRLVVGVSEATIEANELLWQGVLAVDAETINRSIERRDKALPLIEEGIRVMERFCE